MVYPEPVGLPHVGGFGDLLEILAEKSQTDGAGNLWPIFGGQVGLEGHVQWFGLVGPTYAGDVFECVEDQQGWLSIRVLEQKVAWLEPAVDEAEIRKLSGQIGGGLGELL